MLLSIAAEAVDDAQMKARIRGRVALIVRKYRGLKAGLIGERSRCLMIIREY